MNRIWILMASIVLCLVGLILLVDDFQAKRGYPPLFKSADSPVSERPLTKNHPDQKKATPPAKSLPTRVPRTPVSDAPVAKVRGAIILDDIGLDLSVAKELLEIEVPLCFSILPARQYSTQIAELAHRQGKVIMAHIPMEARNPEKMHSGLPWLLVGMNPSKIEKITLSILKQIKYAQGANNHTGSRFTTYKPGLEIFLSSLKRQGMFFIDSRTTVNTKAYEMAQSMGIPSAERNVFFDDRDDVTEIATQCDRFINYALREGQAIGIGHPKKNTITVLKKYIPIFKQKGITLVPVTDLLTPSITPEYLALKQAHHN
ncbi:divergent polysaccharide deacetylase family protein [candidate division CSSED10-310 bacterium]|uniref:Divergent polysaccharide deacetylase family protein n=1 Tax=candidate division CSSED10-310 bacterium TaxID=2855610 RepID=A0ABV6YSA6_UNCC1